MDNKSCPALFFGANLCITEMTSSRVIGTKLKVETHRSFKYNMNRPLEEFQMTVHLFGAVSSPSWANFALRKTATDNGSNYDEMVISTILKNFYVDDCLKSAQTVDEAVQLIDDLDDACGKGGFRLTNWISNNRTVLESVPVCERAKEVKDLDLEHNDGSH